MLSLSEAYRRGEGVPSSVVFADSWLGKAAAAGMPAAQCARAERLLAEASKVELLVLPSSREFLTLHRSSFFLY
jgi:TPR repeat protein